MIRREKQSPHELFTRAEAAKETAHAARAASREIVARCAESRVVRDGTRPEREHGPTAQ